MSSPLLSPLPQRLPSVLHSSLDPSTNHGLPAPPVHAFLTGVAAAEGLVGLALNNNADTNNANTSANTNTQQHKQTHESSSTSSSSSAPSVYEKHMEGVLYAESNCRRQALLKCLKAVLAHSKGRKELLGKVVKLKLDFLLGVFVEMEAGVEISVCLTSYYFTSLLSTLTSLSLSLCSVLLFYFVLFFSF